MTCYLLVKILVLKFATTFSLYTPFLIFFLPEFSDSSRPKLKPEILPHVFDFFLVNKTNLIFVINDLQRIEYRQCPEGGHVFTKLGSAAIFFITANYIICDMH